MLSGRPRRSSHDMCISPLLINRFQKALIQPQAYASQGHSYPLIPSSPSQPASPSIFRQPAIYLFIYSSSSAKLHTPSAPVTPHPKPINQSMHMKKTYPQSQTEVQRRKLLFAPQPTCQRPCSTPSDCRLSSGLTHRAPVSHKEVLGQRVEGEVAAGAFGVVVRAREAGG